MTATPPPAPDTRPRCGGTPGKPGVMPRRDDLKAHWLCPGCADCQPAPTPSGDARPFTVKAQAVGNDAGAFLAMHFNAMPVYAISESDGVKGHDLAVTWAKEPADRIVKAFTDAAALQEAREEAAQNHDAAGEYQKRIVAAERALQEARAHFETRLTAYDAMRDAATRAVEQADARAEAAEARLREVEGARDALDASLRSVCGMVALAAQDPSRHLPGELVGLARRTIQSIDAASRPVPAAPCQMCKHDPVDHWEDGRCVRCLSGRCAYTPTPAATPSTDEEGRKDGGHGHVYPRPDGAKARCGGPALCSVCARDAAALARSTPTPSDGGDAR